MGLLESAEKKQFTRKQHFIAQFHLKRFFSSHNAKLWDVEEGSIVSTPVTTPKARVFRTDSLWPQNVEDSMGKIEKDMDKLFKGLPFITSEKNFALTGLEQRVASDYYVMWRARSWLCEQGKEGLAFRPFGDIENKYFSVRESNLISKIHGNIILGRVDEAHQHFRGAALSYPRASDFFRRSVLHKKMKVFDWLYVRNSSHIVLPIECPSIQYIPVSNNSYLIKYDTHFALKNLLGDNYIKLVNLVMLHTGKGVVSDISTLEDMKNACGLS